MLTERLTLPRTAATVCPMKPPIYLTDPKEMLKVRLNQPRATSEQLRLQRERLKLAAEKFFADTRRETSLPGQKKMRA